MKKIFILLFAAVLLFSSVSLAEDLASLSDADLLVLYKRVSAELEGRGISVKAIYPENVYQGSDLWDNNMAERLDTFFSFWYVSDIPNMLTVCTSDWKAEKESPDTELSCILGNMTPLDYTVISVSGGSAYSVRNVELIAEMDQNNEASAICCFNILLVREEDGLWYIDPDSLLQAEKEEDRPQSDMTPESAEETAEISDGTLLYYYPGGGQYYHLDQNCVLVNPKYLPLHDCFTYAELEKEEYKDLKPCNVCGAPLRR